ncbi:MAG: hypothetical protein IKE91_03370 [Clostridia bacterium]|nr:hypothetical protein [Clostridia bacterium]
MKILKKIKYGLMMFGTTLMMLPTKIFAADPNASALYGPPEDYNIVNNTAHAANKVSEASSSFELDSMFLIRCLTFFLVPVIFLLGLIIFAKASKSKKSTKVIVSIFVTLLIIAMFTGAVLFVVGSILGWF